MANVESRAPIVRRDIVRVHVGGGSAIGVSECVEAEEIQLRSHTQVEVRDQLILVEEACRLELIDVCHTGQGAVARKWALSSGTRQRVDIAGQNLVNTVRAEISDRDGSILI